MKRHDIPLLEKLVHFSNQNPVSFHVPGHKNGLIFPEESKKYFQSILPIDVTELTGLDDLHAPQGVIREAEQLAAAFFQADHTFFLVGGSTAGNLSMILATCSPGDKIIVQRNCHKSIMNGLELALANPVFIKPEYDQTADRYIGPSLQTVKEAIQQHPDAKGLVLTYPDYFGKTYRIKEMIEVAHQHNIPVLVDEAHGVHFSIGDPFPNSALELGADVVVQSAHKMAPAMTMASYLHMNGGLVDKDRIAHYLQMLQSSSPSYPIMTSLDIARFFLASFSKEDVYQTLGSVRELEGILEQGTYWDVLKSDDPLKITLHMKNAISGYDVSSLFEKEGVYPELATTNQILFIHGLAKLPSLEKVEKVIKSMNEQLKYSPNHATIDIREAFSVSIQELALPYIEMNSLNTIRVSLKEAKGYIAAEAIIPYPPGIPLIVKGERITAKQIEMIQQLIEQGATIQHRDIEQGIQVFQR